MASYTYAEHSSVCKSCRLEHGDDLPVPKDLSYEEISALATKFSNGIFADWTQLNAILKRFEGVIQKRWTKKGFKQRREVLLKACPDMPSDHRPDFASFRNMRNRNTSRSSTCISAAFLWPYINLEDLQQPHILPLFLNSRGRNLPKMFLDSDIRSAHLGKGWGFAEDKVKGPDESSMSMHFRAGSPRSYGRLVLDSTRDFYDAYKKKEFKGLDAARLWDQHVNYYHPGLGLMALEIQQGVYSFLLASAKLILHDYESKDFFLAPWTAMPAPLQSPTHEWPSLTAHQLETPYRVPQKLDLDRIRMLVASRRESAEDHLWMLREDPSYFASTYEEWAEHDEQLLYHRCPDCVQRVVGLMVSHALDLFVLWDYVDRKFQTLSSPDKDQYTWTAILLILDELESLALYELKSIQCAPRARYIWDLLKVPEHLRKNRNRDSLKDFERRVLLLFNNLLDPDKGSPHTLHALVQEMQYMLDTDANANRIVGSWLIGHFSDLALVTELKFQLEGLRPWAARWRTAKFKTAEPVEFFNELVLKLVRSLGKDIMDMCKDHKDLIGDPSDGRLNYPISKAYTKSNVEQLRSAESRLDTFWCVMEVGVAMRSGLSIAEIVSVRCEELHTLYRTEEWKPVPLPPAKATVLNDVSTNVPRFHDDVGPAINKLEFVKAKSKIKTRGIDAPACEQPRPSVNSFETSKEPPVPKVSVPKRTYKVLSALFPGPTAENHQRTEIAWFDFLHAMDAIGLQPEKLYGSVWVFRPKTNPLVEAKRSIQFHEPKEIRHGGKISAAMVRVFGRRLKRAYGWESEMFESK